MLCNTTSFIDHSVLRLANNASLAGLTLPHENLGLRAVRNNNLGVSSGRLQSSSEECNLARGLLGRAECSKLIDEHF
jgi:hypothetical protein